MAAAEKARKEEKAKKAKYEEIVQKVAKRIDTSREIPVVVGKEIPSFLSLQSKLKDSAALESFSMGYVQEASTQDLREALRNLPGGYEKQLERIAREEVSPIVRSLAEDVRAGWKTEEYADAELRGKLADIISKHEGMIRETPEEKAA